MRGALPPLRSRERLRARKFSSILRFRESLLRPRPCRRYFRSAAPPIQRSAEEELEELDEELEDEELELDRRLRRERLRDLGFAAAAAAGAVFAPAGAAAAAARAGPDEAGGFGFSSSESEIVRSTFVLITQPHMLHLSRSFRLGSSHLGQVHFSAGLGFFWLQLLQTSRSILFGSSHFGQIHFVGAGGGSDASSGG